ncbi:site-specific integrase [uncultured Sphingomonas sp.]|uniref:tyrosine-type recombinase/integrase n=1 Tax=uncultured Sphingomonas sp. TaxID=158754 RepID=UPI0025F39E92|nr:site-specific integrase [uncultured Sphingomonas sp.]
MALRFSKLTRPACRALKAGETISEHGISVKRLASGDLAYSVNVMVDGQRIHRAIGRESQGVTREQAEQAIEAWRTDARHERLNLPTGRKLHRSFAEAAKEYLARMTEADGKDMANKRRHLDTYLVPFLGKERLDKITDHRLRQYRKHRTTQGAMPATVNRELATLSHLMRRAASKGWGWIKPDAIPEIPKEMEARKQIRVLSADQCQRLIEAAEADHDPHAHLFVLFGLNTAMRHSEIVCRRFDEVDFEHNRLWIDRAKAGQREQPITVSLAKALQHVRAMRTDPKGWIFPAQRSDSKEPHRRDLRDAFARCVTRAGLDPKQCTPHVMRHTAITRLVKARVDLPTIKRISGHKTTAMVEHYTHIHGVHIDEAVSALDTSANDATSPELHAAEDSQPCKADRDVVENCLKAVA